MPKILLYEEIGESIKSLNLKQREVFNVHSTLAKYYAKYDRHNVESVYIFLSSNESISKFHVLKVIYTVI